jgi:hypothetical protein
MGFALSWLAVKGKAPEAIHDELQLRATGRREEIPESPLVGSLSAAGWYLIVAQQAEHRLVGRPTMEQLSRGCEAIACTVEEHVMYSESSGWRDGKQLWLVTHSGEDGPKDVSATGSLPPSYAAIRDRFIARQEAEGGVEAEVDYLSEIPVVLAQSFVDFKHDAVSPAFEAQGFEILESTQKLPASPKSWLGRLFSR